MGKTTTFRSLAPRIYEGGALKGRGEYMNHERKNEELARHLRKNMTPWERKLWYEFLRNYPVRFQRQKAIGNYIVDFYCPKLKLIIEINGEQHYLPENKEYEQKRTEFLEKSGYRILSFYNSDISRTFYRNVSSHKILCKG